MRSSWIANNYWKQGWRMYLAGWLNWYSNWLALFRNLKRRKITAEFKFTPADLFLGIYAPDPGTSALFYLHYHLYIVLIPMLPLHIYFAPKLQTCRAQIKLPHENGYRRCGNVALEFSDYCRWHNEEINA